MLRVIIWKQ